MYQVFKLSKSGKEVIKECLMLSGRDGALAVAKGAWREAGDSTLAVIGVDRGSGWVFYRMPPDYIKGNGEKEGLNHVG